MSDMTIEEFCDRHGACPEGRDWALANCQTMADVWAAAKPHWLVWVATRPGVLTDGELRRFAVWSARQVQHLMTDTRSLAALDVAERHANGQSSREELAAAEAAAWDAAEAAARAAARDAARAAAEAAQSDWLRANARPCFVAQPFANTKGTCETGETQSGLRTERVTERRPPEPGGGGNVTGLRTERVTLEISHNCAFPLNEWLLEMVDDVTSDPGESVRVVEETHFDDLAQVAMERDAAIRERDNLRAERITQRLTADRFAASVAEADTLRARVAELESQLESVACRAATAETALRQILAQDYSRAAVNGAAWKMHDIAEKALESAPAASVAAGTEAAGTELPTD